MPSSSTLRAAAPPGALPATVHFQRSRAFSGALVDEVLQADIAEALRSYGRTLEVRRPGPLLGQHVDVTEIVMLYDRNALRGIGEDELEIAFDDVLRNYFGERVTISLRIE